MESLRSMAEVWRFGEEASRGRRSSLELTLSHCLNEEVSVNETEVGYQGRSQEGSTEGEASAGGGGGMLLFKYIKI